MTLHIGQVMPPLALAGSCWTHPLQNLERRLNSYLLDLESLLRVFARLDVYWRLEHFTTYGALESFLYSTPSHLDTLLNSQARDSPYILGGLFP